MLSLEIRPVECYDEDSNTFYYAYPWTRETPVQANQVLKIQLEHSLLSLSRWEEKWKIPFLVQEPPKTNEQMLDYIRFMTLTKNVPFELYNTLTPEQMDEIASYIEDEHTATWFSGPAESQSGGKKRIITAEIIYHWMLVYNIPWDPAERWHLNKLLTLIRVCSIESAPKKKQSKGEIADEYRKIKAARRAARKK